MEATAVALFFVLTPRWEWLGRVIAELQLWRGANCFHDLYSRYGRRQ